MSGQKDNSGISIAGSVTAHTIAPFQLTGDNAIVNIGSIPGKNTDQSAKPVSDDICVLQEKVTQKLKELKEAGEDFPERELFRTKLTIFYNDTKDTDILADMLYESKVLSNYQRQKVKKEPLDYDKNDILYNNVLSSRSVLELLPALKNSNNQSILDIIEELVK